MIVALIFNYFSSKPIKSIEHIEGYGKDTEVLVLGSSHALNAVIPNQFDFSVTNMAYNNRLLLNDILIAKKVMPLLPKLKVIILPSDYFTLWNNNQTTNFYKKTKTHFNIEYNFLDLLDHPRLCKFNCLETENIDNTGYSEKKEDYSILNDSVKDYLVNNRIQSFHSDFLPSNVEETYLKLESLLKNFIEFCENVDMKVLFVEYPVIEALRENYLDSLNVYNLTKMASANNWNIINLNDYSFEEGLFNDPDHLNAKGAEKASKIINSRLHSIINQ